MIPFGILDRAYVLKVRLIRKKDPIPKKKLTGKPIGDPLKPKSIWFLPANVYDNPIRTANVVTGSSYVFRVHGNAFTSDPREVRDYLEDLIEKAIDRIRSRGIPTNMPIGGVSFGGILANYIANRFSFTSLYLRTPGGDLAVCIRESISTRTKYIKGRFSPEDWEEELSNLSPLNNLDNLPDNIGVLLGRWDLIVPFYQGMLLVDKMREKGLHPKVEVRNSGHRVSYAKSKLFD